MIVVGIDPGLKSTGCALTANGETVLDRVTLKLPVIHPRKMAREITARVRLWHEAKVNIDVVAVEKFFHRPWYGMRVRDAALMGALCEAVEIMLGVEGFKVVTVDPEVSKAGYPAREEQRKKLLPVELKNNHERDAFLAARCGVTLWRQGASIDGTPP